MVSIGIGVNLTDQDRCAVRKNRRIPLLKRKNVWASPKEKPQDELPKNGIHSKRHLNSSQRYHHAIAGSGEPIPMKLHCPVVTTRIAIWESLGLEPVPVPLPKLNRTLNKGRTEASEKRPSAEIFLQTARSTDGYGNDQSPGCVGWIVLNRNSIR